MIDALLAKVFGTQNERELKAMRPIVKAINDLEPSLQGLTDEQLAAKTQEFKQRLSQGETLDDLLPEAFAVVREAGRRVLNMRHFDVQLIGGMTLHKGKIAEMRTGEGKTLVATLPTYLNALEGKGVHVVTVNDYLARRDAEWMGRLYKFLGLTVGVILHDLDDYERQQSYNADITYGTNNEFGFDYLRDNMKFRITDCVQREHNFAIVDEVDSILVDEARTPLIISGPSEEATDKYFKINAIIPRLIRGEVIEGKEPGEKYTTGDYTVDEKHRSVALTEEGVSKVERLLGISNLYEPENIETNHGVQQSLKAHVIFQRDKDYLVQDGQVVIVDEFTGRIMPGRRWSDGLHQAVEAKEGVKIEKENQTLATITFQNYFRMYKKLAGMTGTAETEAAEFSKIYNLDVMMIPTNRPMRRTDNSDMVYRTEEEKFRNAAKEIKEKHDKGQPVLVGTISVEKSEHLSKILKNMGVRHEVLNAKNHEREASIVAQAGRKSAVTVSTNMAGRGTDILLGGNAEFLARERARKANLDPEAMPREQWDALLAEAKEKTDREHDEVVELGGLHIVGTERHESRRIDNQLRGRSGRQGDPGSARFFLSLQDDLLRIFGGEKMQNLMLRLGMEEDVPIESNMITRRIAAAQKAVEAQNFAARKHLLEYDDVMNKQRKAVYSLRRELLEGKDMKEKVIEIARGIVAAFIDLHAPENVQPHAYQLVELQTEIFNQFGVRIEVADMADLGRDELEEKLNGLVESAYAEKEKMVSSQVLRETERIIMLNVIDNQWKDHLLSMDHLKEGIGLRGYGQKDPLIEYKKESYTLFEALMDRIEDETLRYLFFLQISEGPPQGYHEIEGDGNGNGVGHHPVLPFDGDGDYAEEDDADEAAESEEEEAERVAAAAREQQQAAQSAMLDFTRKIERKKERELADLQFLGGSAPTANNDPIIAPKKPGRNDPCFCGSGKKYKKCHGA